MKVNFYSIDYILPSITIKLTHSKKKARKIIEEMTSKECAQDWDSLRERDATTSTLQHSETGEVVYLVWMRPCIDWSADTDVAILAHEATHVAIDYLKSIGEDEPSEELFAYTIQAITGYLVDKHFRWKKKQLAKYK